MTRPYYDPAEIAREALAEMPESERAELLIELLCRSENMLVLAHARNAITDRAAEVIADRYADTIIGENRYECVR
ncbi:MAG: hypothetical protein Q4G26_14735 [Paracoccus sp. (in: a-proteobacteria)]|nr:hypothetical protein [Paracoccus sp. (in: a-proteobacteria)]